MPEHQGPDSGQKPYLLGPSLMSPNPSLSSVHLTVPERTCVWPDDRAGQTWAAGGWWPLGWAHSHLQGAKRHPAFPWAASLARGPLRTSAVDQSPS